MSKTTILWFVALGLWILVSSMLIGTYLGLIAQLLYAPFGVIQGGIVGTWRGRVDE